MLCAKSKNDINLIFQPKKVECGKWIFGALMPQIGYISVCVCVWLAQENNEESDFPFFRYSGVVWCRLFQCRCRYFLCCAIIFFFFSFFVF